MRSLTNDELLAVGGGDQVYEHVEKRMTDQEKKEYDNENSVIDRFINWLLDAIDISGKIDSNGNPRG
ncbi:hypothetical protein [Undibacterium curvum]|uniref:hypothetical protein n=1 Tax=Undibacterium curvum TaxID=2762294 RepID=UPI003D11964C